MTYNKIYVHSIFLLTQLEGSVTVMDEQYIAVRLIHDYILGRPPSVNDFSDRIIAQKIIYLTDKLGIECGDFEFNWYKRGPYSPALTKVLYENEASESDCSKYNLLSEAQELIEPLKRLIAEDKYELGEVDWIELLASTHYLSNEIKDNFKMATKLIELKPKYSIEEVLYAKDRLDKHIF